MSPETSRQDACRLNEDVLRHIVSFLLPEELEPICQASRVFFEAHLKNVYTSLTFSKRDKQMKRLLLHLADSGSNAAHCVRRVDLQPWLVQPRTKCPRSRTEKFIIFLSKLFDPDYTYKVAEKRLQKRLKRDIHRVTSAFSRMVNVEEYQIDWGHNREHHPEFYRAFVTPVLTLWSKHLVKLTLKVPPSFLNSLAGVHLPKLETFCFTFSTSNLSDVEIDTAHTGFIVFMNNLKSTLRSLSFMSVHSNENFDLCRILRFLGTFPLLESMSISLPYDGKQLSDPFRFVRFLVEHEKSLRDLSIFTNRIGIHRGPGNRSCIEWIQIILFSIPAPFPRLRSLALALRPLRHKLDFVINFLDNHSGTLTSLKLMDRCLAAHEICALFGTNQMLASSLTVLHLKVDVFDPYVLINIARRLPNLERLYIECNMVRHWVSECSEVILPMEIWSLRQLITNGDLGIIKPYLQQVEILDLSIMELDHGQIIY